MSQNNELAGLVKDYAMHLHELLDLLELEHEALIKREFEGVQTCTAQKQDLLSKLEKLDSQRQLLEQQAQGMKATEIQACFTEKIGPLLKKCKEDNARNGNIVEISKQFNQRLLNIILGTEAEDSELYDAAGMNTANKLKQVFARI